MELASSYLNMIAKKINEIIKTCTLFAVAFLFFIFCLYLPFFQKIGLNFRYDFLSICVVIVVIQFFLRITKWKFGWVLRLLFTLLLFSLPLSGIWESAQSETYLLYGLIPFSDASSYYHSALGFLNNRLVGGFSAGRTLAVGIYSFLLFIVNNNLQIALVFLCALSAIVVFLASEEIQSIFGVPAAVLFFILCFLFYRDFAGTLLTENIGFPFGLLGFALLTRGLYNKENNSLLFGYIVFCYALFSRPGALFSIPMIIVWIVIFRKRDRLGLLKKILVSILLLITIVGFISYIQTGRVQILSSNFAPNLYRITAGVDDWHIIFNDHPELILIDDNQRNKIVMQYALDRFMQEPRMSLKGIALSYQDYFSFGRPGLFGFIEGEQIHSTKTTVLIGTIVLMVLSAFGVVKIMKKIKEEINVFWLLSGIGLLLSIPFVFSGGGMRFYAASMGFQFIFPIIGLDECISYLPFIKKKYLMVKESLNPNFLINAMIFFLGMLIFIYCSLIFISNPEIISRLNCDLHEMPIDIVLSKGTYVMVSDDVQEKGIDLMPLLNSNRARFSAHGLSVQISTELEKIESPYIIYSGWNFISNEGVILVLHPEDAIDFSISRIRTCFKSSPFPTLKQIGFLFSPQVHFSY